MKITKNALQRFVDLTNGASYNEELKAEYRKLGKKILKEIVMQMGLMDGQYDIRWNPGGIAMSGDHTLHTDKVYLSLCDNCGMGWFYWRTVKGRTDYTGGPNQIVGWTSFLQNGIEPLAAVLKKAQWS
jgi:hypothetical protein